MSSLSYPSASSPSDWGGTAVEDWHDEFHREEGAHIHSDGWRLAPSVESASIGVIFIGSGEDYSGQIFDWDSERRIQNNVDARFKELREQWEAATGHQSSVTRRVMHPAYQRIIGLGPDVLPLLIEDLRKAPNHWFWALASIVGEDHARGASNIMEATRMWVDWFDGRRSFG